nr:MAG TPA: 2'-5' RNA ligase [Caudoviricetes sp.]
MEENLNTGCLMLSTPMMEQVVSRMHDDLERILLGHGYRRDEDFEFDKYTHITVAFGINVGTDINLIKEIIKNRPSYFQITELSLFENDNFDIIKFDVMSSDLRILNHIIKSKMEVKSSYNEYHPHLTVAYVPKGMGMELIARLNKLLYEELNFRFEPLTHSSEYTYSTSMEGERIQL